MKRAKATPPKAASKAKATQKPATAATPEVDRRGKVLPPRQRVGGIITPQ